MAFPIDEAFLKATYLRGLDLTDDSGTEYGATFYSHAVGVAKEWATTQLDLPIAKSSFTERLDYDLRTWQAWQLLQLTKKPVNSITKIQYMYGPEALVMSLPTDWYYLESPNSGQVNIMPTTTEAPFIPVIGGLPLWTGPILPTGHSHIPGWFKVEYEAGWDDDDIPKDIIHLMGMFASMFALNTAGDLIAGAGIASFSVGVDGIHNSINTTCVTRDTRVLLADGSTPKIIDLVGKPRFEIMSYDDGQITPADGILARPTAILPVWEVGLTDGSRVHCSENHLWLTSGGWVEAGRLCEGMPIVSAKDPVNVSGVRNTGRMEQLYDLTVPGLDCFAVEGGAIIHNSSATNSGFGARIIQYNNDIKDLLPKIRARYHATITFDVG